MWKCDKHTCRQSYSPSRRHLSSCFSSTLGHTTRSQHRGLKQQRHKYDIKGFFSFPLRHTARPQHRRLRKKKKNPKNHHTCMIQGQVFLFFFPACLDKRPVPNTGNKDTGIIRGFLLLPAWAQNRGLRQHTGKLAVSFHP